MTEMNLDTQYKLFVFLDDTSKNKIKICFN